jgi:hypothetical protein
LPFEHATTVEGPIGRKVIKIGAKGGYCARFDDARAEMRIVVAITGATGAAYGVRLLAALAELAPEAI